MTQSQGSRMTRQRMLILHELRKPNCHPCADELYHAVRKQLPHVSLGTVYRNLDVLAEAGLVRKLENGPIRRFDANMQPHDHVRCLGCGAVADVPSHGLNLEQLAQVEVPGFTVTGASLEYQGWCEKCEAKNLP